MDELMVSGDRDFMHMQRASIAAALGDKKRAVRELRQMTIRGVMHPEAYLQELRGYGPFEEWMRPRGSPSSARSEQTSRVPDQTAAPRSSATDRVLVLFTPIP